MTRGGRNLIILGVAASLIAVATTGVSLAIYHNSGDIYLDRSRPGFLPDDEEIEQEVDLEEEEYEFEKSGPVTKEVLDEYIEKLENEIKAMDAYEKPFDASALNDDNLGISGE